jgi:hypothetical protein
MLLLGGLLRPSHAIGRDVDPEADRRAARSALIATLATEDVQSVGWSIGSQEVRDRPWGSPGTPKELDRPFGIASRTHMHVMALAILLDVLFLTNQRQRLFGARRGSRERRSVPVGG